MSGYGMPTIRLELDALKYQVVHSLMSHNNEIEQAVAEQITSAIESMDMTALIKETLRAELGDLIKRSIQHEIQKATYDSNSEVSGAFRGLIRNALKRVIDESPTL